MERIKIYTDGGYHPKYKTGAYAYIIKYPSGEVVKNYGKITIKNSQEAELYALEEAIKVANSDDLCVYTDYQPVITAIKQENSNPVFDKIKEIITNKNIEWNWVHGHSESNKVVECDKMCSNVFKLLKNTNI